MWKSGMATTFTDVSSKLHGAATCGRMVPRFALVSMAPLGRPVVPEV